MKNVMLELTRIIQDVAQVEEPAAKVQLLVDSLHHVVQADVCSLYLRNEEKEMVLLASHGLSMHQPVKIPKGKGLVGLVATNRHPLNIEDAANHPDFYYVAQTHEEQFHSFCGVPLVRQGNVIGVLVVQSKDKVKLSEEYEAFLVTLAAHLVLILTGVTPDKRELTNLRYPGVVGAAGIAYGKIRWCAGLRLQDVIEVKNHDVEGQLTQWHLLIERTRKDIYADKNALGNQVSKEVSGIFDAYQMLLADPMLSERVESELRNGYALTSALKLSIQYFAELFAKMEDPYLRARGEDMHHLGNKLYQVWLGSHTTTPQPIEGDKIILIGAQVFASDIANYPRDSLAGVVSFEGSALSHTAVLANALGVPAVMGVGEIRGLKTDEQLIVDGNTGQVIRFPTDTVLNEYNRLIEDAKALDTQLTNLRHLPAVTQDGTRVQLFTNTGLLADIMPGIKNGAEGVGLYRTEIPFMIRQSFPSEDEQVEVYKTVCQSYAGMPVYFRILDVGGDKQLSYYPIKGEENPALGWRGIRFVLDNVQLLMTQIRAIIRASGATVDLHILLPMIGSTNELEDFLSTLADACDQLTQEGVAFKRPKVGVMVEVPAVISLLTLWKDRIDFISVGTNDLSQYLLAIDRNNARVAKRFEPVHPAIIHEINRITHIAKACDLPLSVCGEMASDPVAAMLLIGMGVRKISLSSDKLPRIKWLIRAVSTQQAEAFLQQALKLDTADTIRAQGEDLLRSIGLQNLIKAR